MRRAWLAAVTAIVILIPVTALAADEAPPPIREFDAKTLVTLGRYIYREDQFAWKASDILLAKISQQQLKDEHLNGLWITHLSTGPSVVRFLRDGQSGPEAAYDITFDGDGPGQFSTVQNGALNPDEIAQYNSRKLALSNIARPCSDHYNSVAFYETDGNWLVWALAATTVEGEVVYGGHYRFTISHDGMTIIQRDALSRACLRFPPPDASQGKLAVQVAVQLVSKIPVETTVWLSLLHHTPLIIVTGEHESWGVVDGAMSPLDPR